MISAEFDETSIRDAYLRQRWALLPNFVPEHLASQFYVEVSVAPHRRVIIGAGAESWTEYSINDGHILNFFNSEPIFDLAKRSVDQSLSNCVSVWAQSYDVGERIPWHRDSYGAIQLLLCLQSANDNSGGQFCLRARKRLVVLDLKCGDAVLFQATELFHCIKRIQSPKDQVFRRRTTVVGRYFYPNEVNP